MTINMKDQLDRQLLLKQTPKRIISLVPSQTELLCDLGLEDSLVGVTKFCVHPNHIKKEKIIVGGTKQIKLEKIKELQPDIILCNKEENTKAIVEACEEICTVHVSDIKTIDDCLEMIKQYGLLFDCEQKAKELTESIQKELIEFTQFVSNTTKLKVAYFIWRDPWMVAGKNTFINYLLELNNFENVFNSKDRYPEVTLKELSSVDLVLLSSEPYPFKQVHIDEIQNMLSETVNIKLVDGEMFSWYGSRLLKAFDYFKKLRQSL